MCQQLLKIIKSAPLTSSPMPPKLLQRKSGFFHPFFRPLEILLLSKINVTRSYPLQVPLTDDEGTVGDRVSCIKQCPALQLPE